MTKYGIDVSKYQGNIDWTKVIASGKAEFVILRAGIGNEKDIRFEEYYNGCQANGIPVGAYWYSKAVSEAQARQEAQKFLQVISGKQFAYPLYFDIEMNQQFALGKAKCSAIAAAFLNVLESAGYFAGIYASKSHLESYLSAEVRSRYAVWVAHYGVKKTTYSGQFGMWQYSDSGTVSGIPDNQVDFDECYVDYPEIIWKAGLNGFPKTVEIPIETVDISKMETTTKKQTIEVTASMGGKTYSGTLTEQ